MLLASRLILLVELRDYHFDPRLCGLRPLRRATDRLVEHSSFDYHRPAQVHGGGAGTFGDLVTPGLAQG